MKLIEQFAETVIQSGTYDPMDRFYVINKIRALVGDQDAPAQDGVQVKDQLMIWPLPMAKSRARLPTVKFSTIN